MPSDEKLAFISLLPDQEEAQELVDELVVLRAEASEETAFLIVPPVRGLEFFANDDVQDALGAWWKQFVPGDAKNVFLLRHEEGLAEWLAGVDGVMIVAIGGSADPSGYEGIEGVTVVQGRSVDTLVEAVTEVWGEVFPTDGGARAEEEQRLLEQLMQFSSINEGEFSAEFDGETATDDSADSAEESPEEPQQMNVRRTPRQEPGPRKAGAKPLSWGERPRGGGGGGGPKEKQAPPKEPDPPKAENPWHLFLGNAQLAAHHQQAEEELFREVTSARASGKSKSKTTKTSARPKVAEVPVAEVRKSVPTPQESSRRQISVPKFDLGGMFSGLHLGKIKGGGTRVVPEELAHLVTARGNLIVVVASRKGGVGKTTHAGAIALVSSMIAGSIGGQAAFVDFNVTNPDAWGQLGLPENAATVRSTIAKLVAGVPNDELPAPAWARGSKLACYPSDRSPAGYSQTEIDRFAEHLKRRYKIVVVDLANHMPEIGDPAGEAVAFWLEHADVLVLPTMGSASSFTGVLDYLDLTDLPPVVVAYIVPPLKKSQNHPINKAFLEEIRGKVSEIVEFPYTSEVDYADYEETPITEVTPELGRAYWKLTEAVIKTPPRVRTEDDDEDDER